MDFRLTDEQVMFKETARKFAETEIAPLIPQMEEKKRTPPELIKKMRDLSFYAIQYPAEYGGVASTYLEYAMVVEEPRRCTAGASLAQLDLMLRLIAREAGPELAGLVARYLVVDERPSQARYIVPSHLARSSTEVAAAERWIRRHLREPFGIADLARGVGTSPRTLARRLVDATGSGPLAFVRRIRVDAARHLLTTTRLSVDEISSRVGYEDPTSLRRAFARLGERPSDSRKRRVSRAAK